MGSVFSDPREDLVRMRRETRMRIMRIERMIQERENLMKNGQYDVLGSDAELMLAHQKQCQALREELLRATKIEAVICNATLRHDENEVVHDAFEMIQRIESNRMDEPLGSSFKIEEVEEMREAMTTAMMLPSAPASSIRHNSPNAAS